MAQRLKSLPSSKSITYLSLEQLLIIHTDQVERYGGSHGIRDLGLIESALFRPQSTFGGEDLYPTLLEKATVLVISLLLNHAFVDGNKRTSMVSLQIFLGLNDMPIKCSQKEFIELAMNIENKTLDKEGIMDWLEKHIRKDKT